MGGFDWNGLEVVSWLLGVKDIEMLIERLAVIKMHKPGLPGGMD